MRKVKLYFLLIRYKIFMWVNKYYLKGAKWLEHKYTERLMVTKALGLCWDIAMAETRMEMAEEYCKEIKEELRN